MTRYSLRSKKRPSDERQAAAAATTTTASSSPPPQGSRNHEADWETMPVDWPPSTTTHSIRGMDDIPGTSIPRERDRSEERNVYTPPPHIIEHLEPSPEPPPRFPRLPLDLHSNHGFDLHSRSSSSVICISDTEAESCIDLTNTVAETPPRKKPRKLNRENREGHFGNTIIDIDSEEDDYLADIAAGTIIDPIAAHQFAELFANFQTTSSNYGIVRPIIQREKMILKPFNDLDTVPTTSKAPPARTPHEEEDGGFTCNICMESVKELRANNKKIVTTPCGHPFCKPCLEQATKAKTGRIPGPTSKNNDCPKCRKKFSLKQCIELFI